MFGGGLPRLSRLVLVRRLCGAIETLVRGGDVEVRCLIKRSELRGRALGANRRWAWLAALLRPLGALVSMQCIDARADDFYRGKQINFVVSGGVGGGYDASARLIAQYLPKYIPGAPTIVVQNQPGAGGLGATNLLYNVAPRDGLTIGMVNNTLPFDPLYGNKLARFDPMKFNWIGSPSKELGVFIVWHTVPVNTIDEARKRRLVLSATGTGSTPAFFARTLASIFDLNVQVIPGYKSLGKIFPRHGARGERRASRRLLVEPDGPISVMDP